MKDKSQHYDNVTEEVFINDLMNKDYCIMLYNEKKHVKGFSTQKELSLDLNGKIVSPEVCLGSTKTTFPNFSSCGSSWEILFKPWILK